MPLFQARLKASKLQWEGQDQALEPISELFLKALRMIQHSGKMIMIAHTARKPCEKALSTRPPFPLSRLSPSPVLRESPVPVIGLGRPACDSVMGEVMVLPRSELDAVTAGGPERDSGNDQGHQHDDHALGAGVAALPEVQEVAHQVGRHDLAVVVGTSAVSRAG